MWWGGPQLANGVLPVGHGRRGGGRVGGRSRSLEAGGGVLFVSGLDAVASGCPIVADSLPALLHRPSTLHLIILSRIPQLCSQLAPVSNPLAHAAPIVSSASGSATRVFRPPPGPDQYISARMERSLSRGRELAGTGCFLFSLLFRLVMMLLACYLSIRETPDKAGVKRNTASRHPRKLGSQPFGQENYSATRTGGHDLFGHSSRIDEVGREGGPNCGITLSTDVTASLARRRNPAHDWLRGQDGPTGGYSSRRVLPCLTPACCWYLEMAAVLQRRSSPDGELTRGWRHAVRRSPLPPRIAVPNSSSGPGPHNVCVPWSTPPALLAPAAPLLPSFCPGLTSDAAAFPLQT